MDSNTVDAHHLQEMLLFFETLKKSPSLDTKISLVIESINNWFQCQTEIIFLNLPYDTLPPPLSIDGNIDVSSLIITDQSLFISQDRRTLIIPIPTPDRNHGVMRCVRESRPFEVDELPFLEFMASQLVITIENDHLIKSDQLNNRIMHEVMELGGLITSDIRVGILAELLLQRLITILPTDVAGIWLVNPSDVVNLPSQLSSSLHLAALISLNHNPEEIEDELLFSDKDKWLSTLIESQHPVQRDPNDVSGPNLQHLGYPENYSAVYSPLLVNEQLIGIILLAHPQPDRYGSDALKIVSIITQYAAVFLNLAQSYSESVNQAWISTILQQITEATQSVSNIDELLDKVVSVIPQLVEVDSCAIFLWNPSDGLFTPHSSSGLSEEQKEYFMQFHIQKDQLSLFEKILISNEPLYVNDEVEHTDLYAELVRIFNIDMKFYLLFPMISHSELQGAILVDFREIDYVANDDLFEVKYQIIKGVANQLAVAIDNFNLIRAQEEESYVTIALLQVAQAIVNSADMGNALSVIARITPILVSMRRCVIYLWDFKRNLFTRSESYGITRSELDEGPNYYTPAQFAMLELVRQNDQLACYLIAKDTFQFTEWQHLDEPDCVLLDISESDRIDSTWDDTLGSKVGLLIAYPISIKGVVYGVMVTEENVTDRGIPSKHIRERRIEIVTGITQQTALALQNYKLQIEGIRREQFERELQLAREIQSNFMPDKMPVIPGWTLAAKWKPALQVGGDYFDVFSLSDGSIGCVIADVADKGMPAALFMTLVRTYMRATVTKNNSPAAVLQEVNSLLYPDAKNSMFVTVVYGVFNPDNGELRYTNAGHISPFVIQNRNRGVHELTPCGMALGILPRIILEERMTVIKPGECLLLFTDGISEAFSPSGEMYGGERLKHLILTNKTSSPEFLLNLIEDDITKFAGSSTEADDLTLLAVNRNIDRSNNLHSN